MLLSEVVAPPNHFYSPELVQRGDCVHSFPETRPRVGLQVVNTNPVNPAVRGGTILLLCLLSIFPCGAALTVLGAIGRVLVSHTAGEGVFLQKLATNWIPLAWAGAGALGFFSLIHGVDQLMLARGRLPWYALLRILVGLCAAGLFAVTYPLRGPSALLFRIICAAPVVIAMWMIVRHVLHFRTKKMPASAFGQVAADESASKVVSSQSETVRDRASR